MTINGDQTGEPVPGRPIYTADGDEIGTVKELRGAYIKVDAPMRPDYWLSRNEVAVATSEAVTLTVDTAHLDALMIGDTQIDETGDRVVSRDGDLPSSDTNAMPPLPDEGLLAGEPQPGNWTRAWSVPVGAAWDQVVANYQIDWQDENAEGDARWEEAEPGLRYGHEMAMDERYAGRTWAEAESELGHGYAEWSRQQGYASGDLSWESARENVRRSWERQRRSSD